MLINTNFKSNLILEFYPEKNNELPRNLRLIKNPQSKLSMEQFTNGNIEEFSYDNNLTSIIYNIKHPIELITIADEHHTPVKISIDINNAITPNEILLNTNLKNVTLKPHTNLEIICIRKNNFNVSENFGWKFDEIYTEKIGVKNMISTKNGYSHLKYGFAEKIFCQQFKCFMGNKYFVTFNISSSDKKQFCYDKHIERYIEDTFDFSDTTFVVIMTSLYLYGTIFVVSRNMFIDFKY